MGESDIFKIDEDLKEMSRETLEKEAQWLRYLNQAQGVAIKQLRDRQDEILDR